MVIWQAQDELMENVSESRRMERMERAVLRMAIKGVLHEGTCDSKGPVFVSSMKDTERISVTVIVGLDRSGAPGKGVHVSWEVSFPPGSRWSGGFISDGNGWRRRGTTWSAVLSEDKPTDDEVRRMGSRTIPKEGCLVYVCDGQSCAYTDAREKTSKTVGVLAIGSGHLHRTLMPSVLSRQRAKPE